MNKNKKRKNDVEFSYVKGDMPETLRFSEVFYETDKAMQDIIDYTERVLLRTGHSILEVSIKYD